MPSTHPCATACTWPAHAAVGLTKRVHVALGCAALLLDHLWRRPPRVEVGQAVAGVARLVLPQAGQIKVADLRSDKRSRAARSGTAWNPADIRPGSRWHKASIEARTRAARHKERMVHHQSLNKPRPSVQTCPSSWPTLTLQFSSTSRFGLCRQAERQTHLSCPT